MRKEGIILKMRNSLIIRRMALLMAVVMVSEILLPLTTFALTSGPAQEEYTSFEPFQTTDMVDLYSGDFTYNIPLMNIPGPNGGYPINIAYHSGIGMEQEASWVGLGWTLNVGAINRVLRGLPDDFNGEEIDHNHSQLNFNSISAKIPYNNVLEVDGVSSEMTGGNLFSPQFSLHYNNYKGVGYSAGINYTKLNNCNGLATNLGLSFDSNNGVDFSGSFSMGGWHIFEKEIYQNNSLGFGFGYNSRQGLTSVSILPNSTGGKTVPDINTPVRFNTNYVVPVVNMNTVTTSANFVYKSSNVITGSLTTPEFVYFGKKIFDGTITSSQVYGDRNLAGYGYLNAENNGDSTISDIQPGSITYNKGIPNLGVPTLTQDLFCILGQGTGGQFRAYRNDWRIYSPTFHADLRHNAVPVIGAEHGQMPTVGGIGFHDGIDIGTSNFSYSHHGGWNSLLLDTFGADVGENEFVPEYAYFQMIGEKVGEHESQRDLYGLLDYEALRFDVYRQAEIFENSNYLTTGGTNDQRINSITSTSHFWKDIDDKRRTTNIDYLTWEESDQYGFSNYIEIHNANNRTNLDRTAAYDKSDVKSIAISHGAKISQISEINVLQANGSIYNYGLPAYNLEQRDVTFRAKEKLYSYELDNDPGAAVSTGVTGDYRLALLNSDVWVDGSAPTEEKGNSKALDELVSSTSTPAYPHSWLLTSVLSYDYLDTDGEAGPSDGDQGYWVKFNYKKVTNISGNDYHWRIPFTDAHAQVGQLDYAMDNVGTYSYGEKEIYYTESIETKTHIAIFYTSERNDARGAASEFFSLDKLVDNTYSSSGDVALHKLDKIELYSKEELTKNGGSLSGVTPIQTVHLDYTYDLCNGVHNYYNSSQPSLKEGKLTLDNLYFTYNGSERGAQSSYVFEYASNPDYNPVNVDMWGNYKDNSIYQKSDYPHLQYPYVEQYNHDGTGAWNSNDDRSAAEEWASAWCLSKIIMPSGGELNIEYEPDDYAYVEDKKAMQMFDIVDINNSDSSPTLTSTKYAAGSSSTTSLETENKYIWIELKEPLGSASDFYEQYLQGVEEVYFEAMIHLLGDGLSSGGSSVNGGWELIKGWGHFTPISANYGLNGTGTYGYIVLDNMNLGRLEQDDSKKVHPFKKMGLEFIRNNRQDIMFGGPSATSTFDLLTLLSFVPDLASVVLGANRFNKIKHRSNGIRLSGSSKIRLNSPSSKLGGGSRVKKLYLTEEVFSGGTEIYGQSYDYTDNGISSGVAYEPSMGGNESPLVQPIMYETKTAPLVSPNSQVIHTPLMKEYYPGASVGYGKVTVRSINSEAALLDFTASSGTLQSYKTSVPESSMEFYTPKDFPVILDETPITDNPKILNVAYIPGVGSAIMNKSAKSQGYSIILNDMAGRLKKSVTYMAGYDSQGIAPVELNSVEYKYLTEPDNPKLLKNKVQAINSTFINDVQEGLCFEVTMGEKADFFSYLEQTQSISLNASFELNLTYLVTPGAPPVVTPIGFHTIYNDGSFSEFSFQSAVTTKVVHKSAILDKTIVKDKESETVTQNLIFDIETGEPIYTSVENNYRDKVYNLVIPGYLQYPNLHGAYRNLGRMYVQNALVPNITHTVSGFIDIEGDFIEGDELWVTYNSTGERLTVVDVDGTTLQVITEDGAYFNQTSELITSVQVIKSGYDNLQTVKVGSYTSLGDMLAECNVQNKTTPIELENLLMASAVSLKDEWKIDKELPSSIQENPYKLGMKGLWLVDKSYVYAGERTYESANIDVRNDGLFSTNIYNIALGGSNSSDWQLASENTLYSSTGFNIESKDAIGNYSAALYGYGNSLVTALSGNARYNEILFDGFEDYEFYLDHDVDHWNFDDYLSGLGSSPLVETQAHSGRYSLRIDPSSAADITNTYFKCLTTDYYTDNTSNSRFEINPCGTNGKFSPERNEKYFVSVWVKSEAYDPAGVSDASIVVTFKDNGASVIGTPVTLIPSGSVIEGWQKISGYVQTESGYETITLSFVNGDSSNDLYFDDLRMHPANASMVSYVYDKLTLKPSAILDDNNFATFFVYNDQGQLYKKKIETREGIKTISEGRTGDIQN